MADLQDQMQIGFPPQVEVPRVTPRDIYLEVGSTGLRRASGIVIDEPLATLRGRPGRRIYTEMATDPVISAFLFAIEKVIARLSWRVDPGEESKQGAECAEFIDGALNDMSDTWDATLSEILTCLIYGWSFHELVYKRRMGQQEEGADNAPPSSKFDDGKIGWRKWAPRAQETTFDWVFDTDGGVRGMRQTDPWSGKMLQVIPIQKALLFRTTSRRKNPEGLSVLRGAYRPWFFRKRIEEIEAIGVERDLAGLPVGWVDPAYLDPNAPAATKAVMEAIRDIVQNIKRNEQEGVVFPLAYNERGERIFDLTLLSTGGQRQFDTDAIIGRYDQRIAMSVLADWLLLGHEKVGSFALGTSKMDMWTMSVDAIATAIKDVINSHAIPRLLRLNGELTAKPPQLAYGDVSQINLTEIADFVSKFVTAGVLNPDDRMESYLRDIAGLPTAENETAHADAASQAEEDRAAMAEIRPDPAELQDNLQAANAQAAPVKPEPKVDGQEPPPKGE